MRQDEIEEVSILPTQTPDERPDRPSTSVSLLFSGMTASSRLLLTTESASGGTGFVNPATVTQDVVPTASPSAPAKSSSSNVPLVAGLISALGLVTLLLGFLAFRLRSKRAAARRGHQLHSPREKNEDDKMEMLESPSSRPARTRSLLQAFPLPPSEDGSRAGSRAGAFSPDATSVYSDYNTQTIQVLPTYFGDAPSPPFSTMQPVPRPRKKSATRMLDRRSVVSWFSISSSRKKKKGTVENAEWYRSGMQEFESGFDPDRPPSANSHIPVNLVERASPLTELSRLAIDKLWAKSHSTRSVASASTGLQVDSPRHHHLSRDLPRSENGEIEDVA